MSTRVIFSFSRVSRITQSVSHQQPEREREPEGLRFCYALDVELNFLHINREEE